MMISIFPARIQHFFGEKSTPTYDLGTDNLPEINDAFYMSMKYVKTLERFDVLWIRPI